MLGKLIINDISKQKRTFLILMVIAIPVFISFLLFIDFSIRYESYLYPLALEKGMTSWQMLLKEQKIVFFKEYLPLFGAIIMSALFDSEYKNNGWSLFLTHPVSREKIIISKFLTGISFITIMILVNIISLIIVGKLMNFPEAVEITYFIKMFFIQLISASSVMTIHLLINIKNKNTMVSIGIGAVMCFISSNLFFNDSDISKFNPYSFASFSDGLTPINLVFLIVVSIGLTIVGLGYTVRYFNKKQSY